MAVSAANALPSTAVPAWQERFTRTLVGAGGQSPLAARQLVDGAVMLVVNDVDGITAVRYDLDGNLLSSASFHPEYAVTVAAIGSFGDVYVSAAADTDDGFTDRGDIWTMKYDGFSGQPLWPSAAVYEPPFSRELPGELLVDQDDNLVLSGSSASSPVEVILKYDGGSGALLWGPAALTDPEPDFSPVVALDSHGNVFASIRGGSTHQVRTFKFASADGTLVWGPVVTTAPFADERPIRARVDPNGDLVVLAGDRPSLTKYDGDTGAIRWGPVVYQTPAGQHSTTATSLAVDQQGDVVVSGLGSLGSITLKYSGASGGLLWGPRPEDGSNPALAIGIDGRVFGAGLSVDELGSPITQLAVSTWAADSTTGSRLWGPESTPNMGDRFAQPICFVTSDGRLRLVFSVRSPTDLDTALVSRDPMTGAGGPVLFAGGSAVAESTLTAMTKTPDGNVVVTGQTKDNFFHTRIETIKLDRATGQPLWGPVVFDPNSEASPASATAGFISADSSGNVVVVGDSGGTVVLKYDGETGDLLWGPKVFPGTTPTGLAIDTAGNVAVCADTKGPGSNFWTLKLSGSTGSTVWGPKLFDEGIDHASAIGLDASGNVIVTGTSDISGGSWVTLKYGSASGAVLWGPVHHVAGVQTRTTVAVDSASDIVVAGSQIGTIQAVDLAIVKYAGATGLQVWGPVTASATGPGFVENVTIDPHDDVFVTSSVFHLTGEPYEHMTMKMHGSDGAFLWGPKFLQGIAFTDGDSDSFPAFVGFDASDNAVLSVTSRRSGRSTDITTVKYDGAAGAILWGPVFAGGSGRDSPSGISVTGTSVIVAGTVGREYFTIAYTESLGIETDQLSPGACGESYSFDLVARNASGATSWTVVLGSPPPGVTLSSTGQLAGVPSTRGFFDFRVRVQDAALHTAERSYTMLVGEGLSSVQIVATPTASCGTRLATSGSFVSYQWLPGGETTSTITVTPSSPTTYGVIVTDDGGCVSRGSITVNSLPVALSAGTGGAVCEGGTLRLFASGPLGASYDWTGPGGFHSTLQDPEIPDALPVQAGSYTVTATAGLCSVLATTTAAVDVPPALVVTAAAIVCPGSFENIARVSGAPASSLFSWSIENGAIESSDGDSVTFSAGSSGSVHLSVDVTTTSGCVANASLDVPIGSCPMSFYTVTPCRLLDTREGSPLPAGLVVSRPVYPSCGIPPGANAIAINVTVTRSTAPGDLRLFPGEAPPPTSVINYRTGQTRAASMVLSIAPPLGYYSILCDQASGTADVILDVTGYFQ